MPRKATRSTAVDDDHNDDKCARCHQPAAKNVDYTLLMCDGCDRSYHFKCLDPPIKKAPTTDTWYCPECNAKAQAAVAAEAPSERPEGDNLNLEDPSDEAFEKALGNGRRFELGKATRSAYSLVTTDFDGKDSKFGMALQTRTNERSVKIHKNGKPDYTPVTAQTKDGPILILCHGCGESTRDRPGRLIVPCDFCEKNWHLDCMDPPLQNPPFREKPGHRWMCPLHVEHDYRWLHETQGGKVFQPDSEERFPRFPKIRRPVERRLVDARNTLVARKMAMIEVLEEEEGDSDAGDDDEGQTIYRIPERSLKLDFINKMKASNEAEKSTVPTAPPIDLETRTTIESADIVAQEMNEAAQSGALGDPPSIRPFNLEILPVPPSLSTRPFIEQQTVLNLAQLATDMPGLSFSGDAVENLLLQLIADAPASVGEELREREELEALQRVIMERLASMSKRVESRVENEMEKEEDVTMETDMGDAAELAAIVEVDEDASAKEVTPEAAVETEAEAEPAAEAEATIEQTETDTQAQAQVEQQPPSEVESEPTVPPTEEAEPQIEITKEDEMDVDMEDSASASAIAPAPAATESEATTTITTTTTTIEEE